MTARTLTRLFRAVLPAAAGLLVSACSDNGDDSQKSAAPNAGIVQTQKPAAKPETQAAGSIPIGKGFDFYVLSLSWSPTWCAQNDRSGKTQQCASSQGFIVHGLWPQNERGYPEYCNTGEPDRVPDGLGRTLFDIMPSMGLIGHEWRKHGVCSGLSQKDYFAVLRAARQKIRIPPEFDRSGRPQTSGPAQIETAFAAANPGLTGQSMAVSCSGRQLDEIRICFNKDLSFRACGEIDRGGCRLDGLSLPANP